MSSIPLRTIDTIVGAPPCLGYSVVGLFAGIGGIELGLEEAGHSSVILCDSDRGAQAVLMEKFKGIPLIGNVQEFISLPRADVVAAGFPCQDLSQAGRTAGINGNESSLVSEVFRLLKNSDPEWLLLENVPFMLQLDRGEAMRFLARSLEELEFRWAYRVIDTRAFGLPQRRQRVIVLASRRNDPREILFVGDAGEPEPIPHERVACGFYWTEGTKGLGWAVDAVPTLKGGSTIGIPSPPAIRFPDRFIGVPDLRDAERLQGFEPDWTLPALEAGIRPGARWKLVGNAVSVPVARWVGQRLLDPRPYDGEGDELHAPGAPWPKAAWGEYGEAYEANLSCWPVREPYQSLERFLAHPPPPLSERATEGFLRRARASSLKFVPGFLDDIAAHLERVRGGSLAA